MTTVNGKSVMPPPYEMAAQEKLHSSHAVWQADIEREQVFYQDRRHGSNNALRRLVMVGNCIGQILSDYADGEDMDTPLGKEAAGRARALLQAWETALAELRGSLNTHRR